MFLLKNDKTTKVAIILQFCKLHRYETKLATTFEKQLREMGCMELKDLLVRVLYSIDDVVEIIVGDHRTAGEAEATS